MIDGFITALGTPVDEFGNLIPGSLIKHVEDQVAAGASGLLVMGSMGIEPCIKQTEFVKVAATAVDAAKGACPVLVGVMDNSIGRVMDRVESLKGLKIDGVVATTPFYFTATQDEIKRFFEGIAKASPFPLYLYDLAAITKTKITVSTAEYLMLNDNIKGIKTADLVTARLLLRSPNKKDDFSIMFSGLDVFDVAYKYGLRKNLDGMFCCTAPLASRMYRSLEKGDYEEAGKCLDSILNLRDTFLEIGVFQGFTYAMNILGYEGIFTPDYTYKYSESDYEKVRACMLKYGLV